MPASPPARGQRRRARRSGRAGADGRRPTSGYSIGGAALAAPRRRPARPVGVAVDQHADHVGDVVVRAGQPVLQRQEVGAHVLRGAGDEAQDLAAAGAASSSAARRRARRRASCAAAQPLQQRQRAAAAAVHAEPAHAGQPHHLAGRHAGRPSRRTASRRACSAGSTARMWSSMNSMVAITMSPRAMSARQRSSAAGSSPHSAAAWMAERQARQLAPRAASRRASDGAGQVAVQRHDDDAHRASGSAAEMRFGIVQGLDGDRGEAALARRSARCCGAPCRARRTGSCRSSFSASVRPADAGRRRRRRRCARRRRGRCRPRCEGAAAVVELEILAEHRRADVPPGPSSAGGPRCRTGRWRPRSPSAASSARGNPGRGPAPRSPRRGCPGAWRCGAPSACRAPARAAARRPSPRPRDSRR